MIPKRIIQTGRSADGSVMVRAAIANVRLLNPDFEYLFFDDQAVEDFIDREYPHYRPVVDAFEYRIQRYDFFRYLAVARMGGFYFDLDVMLASSLGPLLPARAVFPFERLTWSDYMRNHLHMDWEVGNYAFGAEAGHPFLEAIIQNCVRAQAQPAWAALPIRVLPRLLRDDLDVIYSTGPGLVSRTLAEYKGSRDVTVLFPPDVCEREHWNQFGEFGLHLGVGTWRRERGNLRRRLVNLLGARNEQVAIREGRKLGRERSLEPPTVRGVPTRDVA